MPTTAAVVLTWLLLNRKKAEADFPLDRTFDELEAFIRAEGEATRAEIRAVVDRMVARLKHLEDERR